MLPVVLQHRILVDVELGVSRYVMMTGPQMRNSQQIILSRRYVRLLGIY